MSWWDAKGLTSLATQALKSAQKKIDKVLDIKEEDELQADTFVDDGGLFLPPISSQKTTKKDNNSVESAPEADSFFSSWLSPGSVRPTTAVAEKSLTDEVIAGKKSPVNEKVNKSKPLAEFSDSPKTVSISSKQQTAKKLAISSSIKTDVPSDPVDSCNDIGDTSKTWKQLTVNCDEVTIKSDRSLSDDNNSAVESQSTNDEIHQQNTVGADCRTFDAPHSSDEFTEHSSAISSNRTEHFQVNLADVADCEKSVSGWSEACDSQLWQTSTLGLFTEASSETFDAPVVQEACQSSTSSTTDIQPLHEVSSLEGSLEASADELSEGNKTLIADDSDTNRDDTDVDDMRLESTTTSGIHSDEISIGADKTENNVMKDDNFVRKNCGAESCGVDDFTDSVQNVSCSSQADAGEKSTGSMSPRSIVSTGSYVKNLLEDAMVDNARDSAGSSDPVRNESGGNSGHTSADEIDTTTSSDIEIISHTSASGLAATGLACRPFDVSPSRHHAAGSGWISRAGSSSVGGSLHRRSDSGSSAQSLQSRTEDDFASPDGNGGLVGGDHSTFNRHGREARRSSAKYDPDFQQNNPYDVDKLLKKLAEMAEILDVREKKQLELSHENMDLVECNNDLKNRLLQLEHARETELEERKSIRDECTRKLMDMEKRLQTVLREKELLKVSLHEAEVEIARRSENIVSEKLLKEKEQIIAELMEEGEKLSKKQLQQSNMIKKLRAKEKENDTLIATQKQKNEEQKAEIERLESILDSKVDSEKKHFDAINQLNAVVTAQEEEMNRLKNDLEDTQEKYRSAKVALDSSYKEISELHKARVTQVSETQKAALDAEIAAKEQLAATLEECRQQMKREQRALVTQIEDLQLSVSRMEKEHGRREDLLRQEISDLQQRLQEAEERNHELTQSVSGVTRPLLRQIENLQSTYAAQTASYERVEKNLTDRLVDAQSQLAAAVEKERFASEKLMESTMRISSLESQMSSLRQERSRLLAELDVERAKVDLAEEAKHNETAQKDAAQQRLETELNELKKEKILLENQLEMEKIKVETGKKKIALLHDQIREKDMLLQMTSSVSASPTPTSLSREDSVNKTDGLPVTMTFAPGDASDKLLLMTSSTIGSRASLYDSLRVSGSATSLIESLQSELKQREGEICQLQSEIAELERTRESMARELVSLSISNEDLTENLKEFDAYKLQYKELDQRYNALLQMYGEKVEETQELRLDLQDVKDMYRSQIDELLKSKSSAKLPL